MQERLARLKRLVVVAGVTAIVWQPASTRQIMSMTGISTAVVAFFGMRVQVDKGPALMPSCSGGVPIGLKVVQGN